jgi:hypothetical protein
MDNTNLTSWATTASVGEAHLADLMRLHRKVNDTPTAAKAYRRSEIARAECARRGVRFLPAQCLRYAYERDGVL